MHYCTAITMSALLYSGSEMDPIAYLNCYGLPIQDKPLVFSGSYPKVKVDISAMLYLYLLLC